MLLEIADVVRSLLLESWVGSRAVKMRVESSDAAVDLASTNTTALTMGPRESAGADLRARPSSQETRAQSAQGDLSLFFRSQIGSGPNLSGKDKKLAMWFGKPFM